MYKPHTCVHQLHLHIKETNQQHHNMNIIHNLTQYTLYRIQMNLYEIPTIIYRYIYTFLDLFQSYFTMLSHS